MAGAAPLPMRRAPVPGPQPARASRATARGRWPRSSPTRASGTAAGSGVVGWKTYAEPDGDRGAGLPRRRAPPAGRRRPASVENATDLLIDRRGRAARDQRGRAARRLRVRGVPDLAGRAPPAVRAAAGHDRARGGPAARLERHAALLPPDAHRPGRGRRSGCSARATGRSSAATGSRSAFGIWGALNCRAGFVVEDAAELPGGDRATTSSGWSGRTSRRSPSGTARCASARPAARSRRSSTAASATRSSASSSTRATRSTSTSGSTRRSSAGSTVELRSGMALQVDIIPATGTDYFTTNIEDGIALADAVAARRRSRRAYPGAWARIEARRAVHARRARASSCIRTCCRSPTSRPTCRRSCSGRTAR